MLGAAAAQRLGIDRIFPGERIWVGGMWFYVAGILNPAVLAPEIDSSVLVGYPAAAALPRLRRAPLHHLPARRDQPGPRASTTCSPPRPTPRTPERSSVSQPSAALTAQADAKSALQRPVPRPGRGRPAGRRDRRGQHHGHLRPRTPLRDRPAPRPRRHQRPHPHPVPGRGDPAGPAPAGSPGSPPVRPPPPSTPTPKAGPPSSPRWPGRAGSAAALLIGAVAGLLPALRAARMSPTQALWSL